MQAIYSLLLSITFLFTTDMFGAVEKISFQEAQQIAINKNKLNQLQSKKIEIYKQQSDAALEKTRLHYGIRAGAQSVLAQDYEQSTLFGYGVVGYNFFDKGLREIEAGKAMAHQEYFSQLSTLQKKEIQINFNKIYYNRAIFAKYKAKITEINKLLTSTKAIFRDQINKSLAHPIILKKIPVFESELKILSADLEERFKDSEIMLSAYLETDLIERLDSELPQLSDIIDDVAKQNNHTNKILIENQLQLNTYSAELKKDLRTYIPELSVEGRLGKFTLDEQHSNKTPEVNLLLIAEWDLSDKTYLNKQKYTYESLKNIYAEENTIYSERIAQKKDITKQRIQHHQEKIQNHLVHVNTLQEYFQSSANYIKQQSTDATELLDIVKDYKETMTEIMDEEIELWELVHELESLEK